MEEVKIKALVREEKGTSQSRALRREDFIPAVVYGKGENILLKIDRKGLKYLRQHHFSENVIFSLEVDRKGEADGIPVLLKDYQLDPLTENIIHLDFIKVSMEEKVSVEVPVEIKGEAKGVKEGGGVLEHLLWQVKVECLPKDIPESIIVDVSDLEIGDSLHVEDLNVSEGVKILTSSKEVVVAITAVVEEEAEAEESEEIAEEPEVIKEKKKDKDEEQKPSSESKAK